LVRERYWSLAHPASAHWFAFVIVSHQLSLKEAPEAHFDAREQGWTKVVLKPRMAASLPD